MSQKPNISDAEMHIMEAVWAEPHATAADITEQIGPQTGWHRKTINTLISRLVSKGALGFESSASAKRYFPLLNRDDYVQSVASQMVNRLFGGRVAPIVAHFAEEQALSGEDIEELRSILKELSDDAD
ncbi:MAG: BlaI/MecI/CopY family transcriptional regulator [Xanthomonadales bacterium]|nr:BlaI/MecI/CopY family transcriptional regulator [Xanthomonadales bacterium]